MKKKTPMSKQVRARLREMRHRRPRASRLSAPDWMVACDSAEERGLVPGDLRALRRGDSCVRPNLPRAALAVLVARLPHVARQPRRSGAANSVPFFHWPTLRTLYEFLGLLRPKGKGTDRSMSCPNDFMYVKKSRLPTRKSDWPVTLPDRPAPADAP
jgi:hypothetical protein